MMLGSKASNYDACGLFRAAHSHNPAQYSDIVELTPHFYPHIGAGHKVIHPLSCKHDVDSDLLTLASYNVQKKNYRGHTTWEALRM